MSLKQITAGLSREHEQRLLACVSPARVTDYYEKYASLARTPLELRDIRRRLAVSDMFYLATNVCKRLDMMHPWIYQRVREFQLNPNGYLDLWARDHYKSTIITFLGILHEIIRNPNVTIGIFSHTRGIAKAFLRQLMREMENNTTLIDLFPEIFYDKPNSQAPRWSEEAGLVVKRSGNPKESTVEAWGLVDGQPTSKHFQVRVYDDVVTRESVTNPEQITKTTEAYQLSQNLGTATGVERMVGTRYHMLDTYGHIMENKLLKVRLYPCTSDGTVDTNKSVLLPKEALDEKKKKMGSAVFACQMLQNPLADRTKGFKTDLLNYWEPKQSGFKGMNTILIVDPANSKKKQGDYTGMTVWGLAADRNYYIIDLVYDKLDFAERRAMLFDLHRQYRPTVFYERYGKDVEIVAIKEHMERVNYRFEIYEVAGRISKDDRILSLQPLMEEGRIYIPRSILRVDWENKMQNVATQLVQQMMQFPVGHDDLLDSAARLTDETVQQMVSFPKEYSRPIDIVTRTQRRIRRREAGALAG